MTVRDGRAPLSRRELRERARSGVAPVEDGDSAAGAASTGDDARAETVEPAQPADSEQSTQQADVGATRDETRDELAEAERPSPFAPPSPVDAAADVAAEPDGDSAEASSTGRHDDSADPPAPRDGWHRPLPSDLAAPERTMTRRELRILRERAEAAGQPAPDVVFLPSGETTVTGMIPLIADGARGGARRDAASSDGRASAEREVEVAPEADVAGVVTEEPVADVDAPPLEEPVTDADIPPLEEQPVIPALIEPLPTGGIRFRTDAGRPEDVALPTPASEEVDSSLPAHDDGTTPVVATEEGPAEPAPADEDTPPEIVLDAEPVTGPVPETRAEKGPSTLTPFDALFRPRKPTPAQSKAEAESEAATAEDAAAPTTVDVVVDTSAAPPEGDADGAQGDILAASDPAGRPPFGHWSTQAGDDIVEPPTATSRDVGVGTGAITTHALVLPSIPDAGDPLFSPLTSTGEIMVTGTIDLPRSYGSTGAHPALFDHPDVDALLDDSDREDVESTVAPVRAIRAVSSTTTTRPMIDADERRKSRVLPIVLIVALIVGVAAATLVVASFLFNGA